MYYVLFWKNENLTPDEMNISNRGGIWLHTGITGESAADCKDKVKKLKSSGQGFLGCGYKTKIASEEQCNATD